MGVDVAVREVVEGVGGVPVIELTIRMRDANRVSVGFETVLKEVLLATEVVEEVVGVEQAVEGMPFLEDILEEELRIDEALEGVSGAPEEVPLVGGMVGEVLAVEVLGEVRPVGEAAAELPRVDLLVTKLPGFEKAIEEVPGFEEALIDVELAGEVAGDVLVVKRSSQRYTSH